MCNYGRYAPDQRWLNKRHIIGRAVGSVLCSCLGVCVRCVSVYTLCVCLPLCVLCACVSSVCVSLYFSRVCVCVLFDHILDAFLIPCVVVPPLSPPPSALSPSPSARSPSPSALSFSPLLARASLVLWVQVPTIRWHGDNHHERLPVPQIRADRPPRHLCAH